MYENPMEDIRPMDIQCYRRMCNEIAAPNGVLVEGAVRLVGKDFDECFCCQACLDYFIHHGGSLATLFAGHYVPPTQHKAELEYQRSMANGELITAASMGLY